MDSEIEMAKANSTTPPLPLGDLEKLQTLNDHPRLRPLIAEIERLDAECAALDRELETVNPTSPYELGKFADRRRPVREALDAARARLVTETERVRDEMRATLDRSSPTSCRSW
jgi:hypothetical protein